MRHTFLKLAALVAAVPALAQPRPIVLPLQDVAVEYHSRGMIPGPAGDLTTSVMVRYTTGRRELRIDGPDGRFYAILDVDAGLMTVVMPEQRVYVTQPADPAIMALLQDTGLRRVGVDAVAGLPCTIYDTAVNNRQGRVCLTDDGVLLRGRIAEADRRPELDAVSVTYGRQPARMFDVPAGFQKLNLPMLPFGLRSGPLGGGARGGYPGDHAGR